MALTALILAALILPTAAFARDHSTAARRAKASSHRHRAKASKRRRSNAHRSQKTQMLVIHGAGDGHGVGLSQWGAYGYALHGFTDTEILQHYYQGTSIGHVSKKRVIKVLVNGKVRKVPIEAYVRGVVAAEMPSTWPQAALEAQAIASRTYAITDHAGGKRFDVYSDTRSQMYLGKAAETPASNAAVKATRGQIVTYENKPAITFFFASSGGATENVQDSFIGSSPQPWLKGVPDPYDQGPLHKWTVKVSFAKAERQLKGLIQGSFKGIEVLERGFSPRIVSAYVLGSKGKTEVSGPQLASRLGLYAAWAYFFVLKGGKLHREPDVSGKPPSEEEASEGGPSTEPSGGTGEAPSEGPSEGAGEPSPEGAPSEEESAPPQPELGTGGGVTAP